MKLNPFRWMNQHPTFRVVGGWLLLIGLMIIDWARGPAITFGPFYCVPVIMLSYDTRVWRGLLMAVIAGAAWMLLSTNPGVSLWRSWIEVPVVDSLESIPKALQKKLIERGMVIPPMDPRKQIPSAVVLWLVGSAGFSLVALGFHTIRKQEHKLASSEQERMNQERVILNAITTTLNHEINNPLAIIAAQTDLMEMENRTSGGNTKSLRNIQDAVGRIANFVKDLSAIEEVRIKDMGSSYAHIEWKSGEEAPPKA